MKIVLSRTDSIGDVVLTLPLASFIKKQYTKKSQECELVFLGRNYTKDIIESCPDIDHFISYDDDYVSELRKIKADCFVHVFPRKDIAKKVKALKIPMIIGTFNRLFHWDKCTNMVRFSRKKSSLHESQLNFHLLKPLLKNNIPDVNDVFSTLNFAPVSSRPIEEKKEIRRVLFHPMSNGSAVDWPFEKFRQLGLELVKLGYEVGITGTEKEGVVLREFFSSEFEQGLFQDLTGKFSLKELIAYISKSYALVASSTGPLHIAGVTGIHTIGLFSQVRPMHAGRWSPLGDLVHIVEAQDRDREPSISSIEVAKVLETITSLD